MTSTVPVQQEISQPQPQPQPPPPIVLLDMIMSSMLTQAIGVAAKLGIADLLRDGPLDGDQIAAGAGSDPDATSRLIRTLTGYGIFEELPDGRFALTPLADALRADAQWSMRNMALLLSHPLHWEDWGHLVDAIRTGEPVLPTLRGMGGYEYLAANPEFAKVFEGGMGVLSDMETEPLADAYDWARFPVLVDVFGGKGSLLAAILKRAPNSRGILVDPRAEHLGAEQSFAESGLAERSTVDGTELFQVPPAGGSAYLLKHIVHEWPEAQALQLLKSVRAAMTDDSTLLLMEFVLPEANQRHPGRLVDLWLMVLMGGRERTGTQYGELLAAAGFRMTRVIDTPAGAAVIEARPIPRAGL